VYEPEQGLSRARNAGLDRARGKLIVFTDDDVKPSPGWLEAYWEAYNERPQGYFFGGPVESEFEVPSPDKDLLRAAMPSVAGLEHGAKPRELSRQEILVGANWACPAKYLKEVGQFDEDLGLNATSKEVSVGEENDLMLRLDQNGIRKWYVPSAKIVHFVPETKCTLDHVVARMVATAEKSYRPGYEMPFTVLGMPVGLYKGIMSAYIRWKVREAFGNPWKKEYVKYRMLRKLVKTYYKIES
jgi:GT2 family glycosyltransferase